MGGPGTNKGPALFATVATFEYNHMIYDLKNHYGFENH